MLKITPRRAKGVDPELFKQFEIDIRFLIEEVGLRPSVIAKLILISAANLSKYLSGGKTHPVTAEIIEKISHVSFYVLEKRDKSRDKKYKGPPVSEVEGVEEGEQDYGSPESDTEKEYATILTKLDVITELLTNPEHNNTKRKSPEAPSGEGKTL